MIDNTKERLKRLLGMAVQVETDPFEGMEIDEPAEEFSLDLDEPSLDKQKARLTRLLAPKITKSV